MSGVVYTECGNIMLDARENRLYAVLASDRFRTFTREELCRRVDCTPRQLDGSAAVLRSKFKFIGLDLMQNVWGVGFRLERP